MLVGSIKTFGCKFIQAYGMTETTGAVVALMPEDHDPDGPNAHRLRAAGKAMAGVELRIVDPDTGSDAGAGEVGEIWVRTGQNMLGYWNKPDETAKTITDDGWLKTGDAGYLDADGYLYIHDRVKDMIISGGENIYPAEIENCLMSHPGVADVAAFGIPSEKWGETVHAVVVKAEGPDPTPEGDHRLRPRTPRALQVPHRASASSTPYPATRRARSCAASCAPPFWEGRDRNVG